MDGENGTWGGMEQSKAAELETNPTVISPPPSISGSGHGQTGRAANPCMHVSSRQLPSDREWSSYLVGKKSEVRHTHPAYLFAGGAAAGATGRYCYCC